MNMIEIPIHLIDEDTDQPRYRFDEEALQELMNSIAELGLLSPIKVRKTAEGRYKIIYGNRRFKACQSLGRETIPCLVSEAADELEIYLEQIAENLTREGFTPIEEAEAFHKLLNDDKFRSSTKFLSSKLGKPESYIKNKLELLNFGTAVRKLVVGGTEIRKGCLTEDQLLPLKDLPMEYRDALAMTFARDETPVTDIKRIARMFKDTGISEGLKSKLLFKNGYELLETWSTFEHNRKERARQEAQKAEEARLAAEEAEEARLAAEEADGDEEAGAGAEARGGALEAAGAGSRGGTAGDAGAGENAASFASSAQTRLAKELRELLAAVPESAPLAPAELESAAALPPGQAETLVRDVDALLGRLERQLAEWRGVRETLAAALPAPVEG